MRCASLQVSNDGTASWDGTSDCDYELGTEDKTQPRHRSDAARFRFALGRGPGRWSRALGRENEKTTCW